MAGPLLSFCMTFKENNNPNDILIFLINHTFKDYFKPQSAVIEFKENDEFTEYNFGKSRKYINKNGLLENETELESTRLTKYGHKSYEEDLLKIFSEKNIWEYNFKAYGSFNTYFQIDSKLYNDFLFREKLINSYYPIFGLWGHQTDVSKYYGKKTFEHEIKFRFINSWILIDDILGIENTIAAEKNLDLLVEKLKKFADQFEEVIDYSDGICEGSGYYKKRDVISDKFNVIPKFQGFGFG